MRRLIDVVDTVITGPAVEPLSLDDVKRQRRLGLNPSALDPILDLWVRAARQYFEGFTGYQLITATRQRSLDRFPWDYPINPWNWAIEERQLELPWPPLQSVVSITYDDGDGHEQTLDPTLYRLVAPAGDRPDPGRIVLTDTADWPETICHAKAVRIQYTCGFGADPADVPDLIRYVLLLLVGHYHRFGEEVQDAPLFRLPLGAQMVMNEYQRAALPVHKAKVHPFGVGDGLYAWGSPPWLG